MRGHILAITAAGLLAAAPLTAQATAAALPDTVPTQAGTLDVQRLAPVESAWSMTYLPDGRLLITERAGRLRIFANGRLSAPVTGMPDFKFTGQGGLLGVAVDPDVARNGLVYFYYVEDAARQPANARETGDPRFGDYIDTTDAGLRGGAVARARLVGSELRDVRVIWRQTPKMIGRGHFAGRLLFAPDGKLFITSGDRQRFDPAQDLSGNVGKVVRINPDGTIPPDNPFVGKPGASADVWSLGHRNQLGAAINPATGQLWVHEMGPAGGDEVNVVTPGRDYGWPRVSNGDNYDGSPIPDHVTSTAYEAPVSSWTPSVSPSGMLFHSGRLFPQWRGNVLMGGLSSMSLIRLTLTGNRVSGVETIAMGRRIRDVVEAPDGAVLLLVDGPKGELLRLTPRRVGAQ